MQVIICCLFFLPLQTIDCCLSGATQAGHGIIATDNIHSSLYLIKESRLKRLVSYAGCGRYYTISPDKRYVGFKMIKENGEQTPAMLDLETSRIFYLNEPVFQAGQPSFSGNGKIAFTIGADLTVTNAGEREIYRLGVYSNLCPISPDGNWAVFNDEQDQLWILDLSTSERKRFTDLQNGYCYPRWSRNSRFIAYSTLDGVIRVHDRTENLTFDIGEGSGYDWSEDGQYLLYSVSETNGHVLTGSELFLSKFDGSEKIKLTNTEDIHEIEPSFTDREHIIYHAFERNEIYAAQIKNGKLQDLSILYKNNGSIQTERLYPVSDFGARDSIDVPYLNQVYDTPDWHNGNWSCAPTTAMMAIAYYRRLPHWDCWCSSPYGHTSHFGNYICSIYNFREVTYDLVAQDAGGYDAWGGYGYMWYNGYSPYSRMMNYIQYHDITSWNDDSPTWAETVAEVQAGWPYCMCVGLTTAGHLVLAVGQVLDWHTLIFNDPYGNKNLPSYPNYEGKYSRYDWPGYNNGYENLNQVYWCRGARGDWEPSCDTIVDDLQYQYTGEPYGFYMFNDLPSTQRYFHDNLSGYNGHMWWTYTTPGSDTCYVTWTPALPSAGIYEVFAYIPAVDANANARYQVHYNGGTNMVIINQANYSDQWVSLGTYQFSTSGGYVYLGDATGTSGQHIAFDALKWSFTNPAVLENDNSSRSRIRLASTLVEKDLVVLVTDQNPVQLEYTVFDIAGHLVLRKNINLQNYNQCVAVDVSRLSAGVYFISLNFKEEQNIIKFIKLK